MTSSQKRFLRQMAVICIILCISLTESVSGVTITESPDIIRPGDEISIIISDLRDGRDFSISLEGHFTAKESGWTTFTINDLRLPFNLEDGNIEIRTDNTEITKLSLQGYETSISIASRSVNGHYSNNQEGNITAGVYDYISLSVKMLPDLRDLETGITISGRKKGPEDSMLTFRADGVASGKLVITAHVDGSEELRKEVEISNQRDTRPTGIPDELRSTVLSEDRKISCSGDRGLKATIRTADIKEEPDDLTLIGRCYSVHFETPPRSGSGQISFVLTDEITDNPEKYSLLIAHHDGKEWISLPSQISGNNLHADTVNDGVYALASYQTEIAASETRPTPTPAGGEGQVILSCIAMLILIICPRR